MGRIRTLGAVSVVAGLFLATLVGDAEARIGGITTAQFRSLARADSPTTASRAEKQSEVVVRLARCDGATRAVRLDRDAFLRIASRRSGEGLRLGLTGAGGCGLAGAFASKSSALIPSFVVPETHAGSSATLALELGRLPRLEWSSVITRAEVAFGAPVTVSIDAAPCETCPETVTIEKRANRTFSFDALISNDATVFVGRKRSVIGGEAENLFIEGDRLSGRFTNSIERGQAWFGSGGYKLPLGNRGATIGYRFFRSRIRPGVDFLRANDFIIRGQTDSAVLGVPEVTRGPWTQEWTFDVTRDAFRLQTANSPALRDITWSVGAGWENDLSFGDRLETGINLGGRVGFDAFDATSSLDKKPDQTSQLDPDFWMGSVGLDVELQLGGAWQAEARAYAQYASQPISQQCQFGGNGIGRGYDPLEASGDDCVMALLEIARDPKKVTSDGPHIGPFLALDYGYLTLKPGAVNNLNAGANEAERSSVSLGLRGSWGDHLEADVMVGFPIQASGLPDAFAEDVRLIFTLKTSL